MSGPTPPAPRSERMLEGIGLSDLEERIYESLVASGPGLTPSEVSKVAGVSGAEALRALKILEERGLASRVPKAGRRFVAGPPALALEALILRHQELLDRARLAAQTFHDRFRSGSERRAAADLVEVIDSPELVLQRVRQIWRSASEEVLVFDRPPYVFQSPPYTAAPTVNPSETDALARGVRVRLIYDQTALALEGGLDAAWMFMDQGEDARTQARLPFKLIIADRRIAAMPLVVEEEGTIRGALLVQQSHLLDALVLLFEIFWERAVPLPRPGDVVDATATIPLSDVDKRILSYLVSGMKSHAIARATGLGRSTVERRVAALMGRIGAETRVQLGFQLARLGLVD